MGMAASQARFLSLTARKSNVEYEGQQINQQRTALANESSNLYTELTNIDVPSPPSTSDFYKTVYSFNASEISGAATSYTLESLYSTPEGDYATLSHENSVFGKVSSLVSGTISAISTSSTSGDDDGTEDTSELVSSGYQINIGGENYAIYLDNSSEYTTTLSYLNSGESNSTFGSYKVDGDETSYLPYFTLNGTKYYLSDEQMQNFDDNGITFATSVKQTSQTVTEDVEIVGSETNDTGRTTSITVRIYDATDETKYQDYTYELTCTSVEDEEAYDQAMLDYEYEQTVYEKKVSDINAKTESIQQKDKTLELELKQLDTEQNALATEIDAVQKVIEDNVESTFKTFA